MSGSETFLNRETDSRDYGIDLLRLLCMFMVCVLHVLDYGNFLNNFSDYPWIMWSNQAINTLSISCVNCFIIISGYYGMKSKKHAWGRLIELWICVMFYSIVLGVISFITDKETFGPLNLIRIFLPLTTNKYWFFSAYVIVFLIGPFICKGVEKASKKTLNIFIVIFLLLFSLLRMPSLVFAVDPFVLNSGRSPIWLCFVFFIGSYLYKYPIWRLNGKKMFSFLIFLLSTGFMLVEIFAVEKICALIGWDNFGFAVVNNISIFALLCAICLFYCFLDMRIAPFFKKTAQIFAPCAFGVYLIHMNPYGLSFLRGIGLKYAELIQVEAIPIAAVITAAVVFVICVLLDLIRFWLFRSIRVDVLCKKIGKKVTNLFAEQ